MLYQVDKSSAAPVLHRVDSCCQDSEDKLAKGETALAQAKNKVASAVGNPPILVNPPVFSLPEYVSNENYTCQFSVSATSAWVGHPVIAFLVSIPALGITNKRITASANSALVSFTVPNTKSQGDVIKVTITAVTDTPSVGKSAAVTKSTTVGTVIIGTPSIVIPAAGANVDISSGALTVSATTFATTGYIADTASAGRFKLTSDAAGTQIIAQGTSTGSSYSSYKFTGLKLNDGTTYYLFVYYTGNSGKTSAWSPARAFVAKTGIIYQGANKDILISRHASGGGSVLTIVPTGCKIFVADAKYRVRDLDAVWLNKTVTQVVNPYLQPQTTEYNTKGNRYIWGLPATALGSNSPVNGVIPREAAEAALNAMGYAEFKALWPGLADKLCVNYDELWLKYPNTTIATFPVIQAVQGISVPGITSPLCTPNAGVLMLIGACGRVLDKLDPTATNTSYSNRKIWSGILLYRAGKSWSSTPTGTSTGQTESSGKYHVFVGDSSGIFQPWPATSLKGPGGATMDYNILFPVKFL